MSSSAVNFWQSLSTRITLLVVTVSVTLFVLLAWLTLYHQQLENRNLAERELRTLNLASQATLNRIIRYDYPELIAEVVAELEVHRRVQRALVLDEENRVIFSNRRSEINQTLAQIGVDFPPQVMQPTRRSSQVTYHPEYNQFYSSVPLTGIIDDSGQVTSWSLFIIYQSEQSLVASVYQRRWTLLGELILVLLMASLLRFYLQRRLTKPLEHLRRGIESLSFNEQIVSIPLTDQDELGQMARTIEQVARQRADYVTKLKNLNTAIEQSNECVIITNIQARIEYVNRAFTDVTGYTKAELIGQNPSILQSGSTPKKTYEKLWARLHEGKMWRGELLNKRKDGSTYLVWATITPVLDENYQVTHFIGVEEDITERKADEEKLHFLAYYEPLTALPNRFHLSELLQQVLAAHEEHRYGVLLLLDMDRLQHINDARGYEFGSELIKRFSERLKQELSGREHKLAHLGADVFAVLLPDDEISVATAREKAKTMGQLILAMTDRPFYVLQEEVKITVSIGCVVYPEMSSTVNRGIEAERIIRAAETAMHQAKRRGGSGFEFYKAQFSQQVQQQFEIEKQLRHAIAHDELELYIQSQCLHSGVVISGEALVRWRHPKTGMMSPATFIPIAEQSDLIIDIDRWVLSQVCQLISELHQQGKNIQIAVNISARHFRQSDFESWVHELMETHQLPHQSLTLEITEGVLIDDVTDVVTKMQGLSRRGVTFAIDDFGTGYSSLSYISQLPVHELKIDQSFVNAIGNRKAGDAVIETVIAIANHMDMRVIAEGVETQQQADFLYGVDSHVVMQGYFYARPVESSLWRASLT